MMLCVVMSRRRERREEVECGVERGEWERGERVMGGDEDKRWHANYFVDFYRTWPALTAT